MILLVIVLLLVVVLEIGTVFTYMMADTIEEQVGKRALSVAKTVAAMPEIKEAFSTDEPWRIIQPIAEQVRTETGAEFVVVGNEHGIRYSHPVPERIGKEMVGGDNAPALLQGKSYTSKAVGTLGPSLRGKVPVFGEDGRVIGIVSVGFLLEDIQDMAASHRWRVIGIIALGLLVGVLGAVYLARDLKKSIFGLEPEEISALYMERNAVLQSVREGMIVINQDGVISIVNQAALNILSLPSEKAVVGKPIQEVLPYTRMPEVLLSGEEQLDREIDIGGKEIIVNRIPIKANTGWKGHSRLAAPGEEIVGVVASFRLKSEMDQLNKELSQVKRYAEALRAQTHEFNNILYTVSGLIQLESYQEAIDLINRESAVHQEFLQFIMHRLPDPWLGGILLGFHNRAKELKIDFIVDRESSLRELPIHLNRHHLVSILGNLITNAFEALSQRESGEQKVVKLFMTDIGEDLLFEVEDSGPGVADQIMPRIFEQGFSTKEGENRGHGLPRVRELVSEMGGSVTMEKGEMGGSLFTVAIPKSTQANARQSRQLPRASGDTGRKG